MLYADIKRLLVLADMVFQGIAFSRKVAVFYPVSQTVRNKYIKGPEQAMKYILYCIILIITLISCHAPDSILDTKDPFFQSDYKWFPAKVGNSWDYQYILEIGEEISMDTISVVISDTSHIGGHIWFNLQGWLPGIYPSFTIEDSIIFRLEYGSDSDFPGVKSYLFPDSTPYTFITITGNDVSIERTVTRLDSSITTPAGVFEDCYQFNDGVDYYTILHPDYGIILHCQRSSPPFTPYTKIYYLLNFHHQGD